MLEHRIYVNTGKMFPSGTAFGGQPSGCARQPKIRRPTAVAGLRPNGWSMRCEASDEAAGSDRAHGFVSNRWLQAA